MWKFNFDEIGNEFVSWNLDINENVYEKGKVANNLLYLLKVIL